MTCWRCSAGVPAGAAQCTACGAAMQTVPAGPPGPAGPVAGGDRPQHGGPPTQGAWPGQGAVPPQPGPSGWGPQAGQPGGWGAQADQPGGWGPQAGQPGGWSPAGGWGAPPPVQVPGSLATATTWLLGACGLLHLVSALVGLAYGQQLSAVLDGRASVSDVEGVEIGYGLVAGLQVLLLLATAVVFLFWFSRADGAVRALGAPLRHSSGWAVGSWFVPFLNLVRPKQMTDDLWRATDPALPPGAGTHLAPPVSGLLHSWWGFWLASSIVGGVGATLSTDLEALRRSAYATSVADGLGVVAAVLAVLVVRRLTDRISARARLLGRG